MTGYKKEIMHMRWNSSCY